MLREPWADRGKWEDRNSYIFSINTRYFASSNSPFYMPLAGTDVESSSSTSPNVQFIPPNSGRLVSLAINSNAASAPGSTVVVLTHNGGPGEIGRKTITIGQDVLALHDFTENLTSGTMEWDINDGTSLAIQLNPTNTPDSLNIFVKFEIYK